MEYIQQEINTHKNKLMSLINNLINTQLINEEIFINNEIKKESECLISLLNVKQNCLMNPININNNIINPFMHQPNLFMMNELAINNNQLQPEFISNNFQNNNGANSQIINVQFQKDTTLKNTLLHCNPNEKISNVIKKYREKANDYDEKIKFIFNGKELNPSLTLSQSGIVNNHIIRVIRCGALKG